MKVDSKAPKKAASEYRNPTPEDGSYHSPYGGFVLSSAAGQ
ncbi:hypothetical protein [Eisenbergiella sp.]|nr:hypothetical protein [Eisenbergiella sp.]